MISQILKSNLLPTLPYHPLDIFTLKGIGNLGIESVRECQHFLITSPLKSSQKTIIIFPADRLTLAAQNALLKILEEPPAYAQILLVTPNPDALIPTILSRCTLVVHPELNTLSPKPTPLLSFLSTPSTPAQAVAIASTNKSDRETLLSSLTDSLVYISQQLLKEPSPTVSLRAANLLETYLAVKQNANLSLSLSHLYLHWHS